MIVHHLEQDGLSEHIVDMVGVEVSWTDTFRQWGKSPLATSDIAWKSSALQVGDFKFFLYGSE